MIDPISWAVLAWALKYGAEKSLDSALQHLQKTDLNERLSDVCEEWAEEHAEYSGIPPKSLLGDLFDLSWRAEEKTVAREHVVRKVNRRIIPSGTEWHEALLEQWEAVRARISEEERHPFFREERDKASDQLEDLASRLEHTCARHEELFRTTVYHSLNRISGRVVDELEERRLEKDLAEIQRLTRSVLEQNIPKDIGGVEIEREDILQEGRDALSLNRVVAITGPPGTGKSVLLRQLAEEDIYESLVLSGSRIHRAPGVGWGGLGVPGVDSSMEEVLLSLSSEKPLRIYVDDLHEVASETGKEAINDLLYQVQQISNPDRAEPRISVVFSARDQYIEKIYRWFQWADFGDIESISVPALSDEVIRDLQEELPQLARILANETLRPVTEVPFFLRLIADDRMVGKEEVASFATEIELLSSWWKRVVREDGSLGVARAQGLLELGEMGVRNPRGEYIADDINSEALHSLEHDRILSLNYDGDRHRFAHDIFEDWVLFKTINRYREEVAEYLADLGQPLGLLRPVQLLGAHLLEDGQIEDWSEVLKNINQSDELSKRWSQAVLTAPLTSARSRELLESVEDILFSNEGAYLRELLVALRTTEIYPNVSLAAANSALEESQEEILTTAYAFPIPNWRVWTPFMDWFVDQLDRVPSSLRNEASKIMEMWQEHTSKGDPYRREVGEAAFEWLQE